MTKLIVTMIEWEYPTDAESLLPFVWDLDNANSLMALYLSLANGIIVEMRADADSEDSLATLRGTLLGAGGCTLVEASEIPLEKLWLYKEHYECYKQGHQSPAYMFVNPQPQPHKFVGLLQ